MLEPRPETPTVAVEFPRAVIDIESLLPHAEWIASVAKELAQDRHHADDIVQETWLAILTKPPQEGDGMRGWLATVIRSKVFIASRERTRRHKRERRFAPKERAIESPDSIAERGDLIQTVIDQVLALPEPYRSTILHRYFEQKTPSVIAEERGIREATVRTRIHRGLALLRKEISRRDPVDDPLKSNRTDSNPIRRALMLLLAVALPLFLSSDQPRGERPSTSGGGSPSHWRFPSSQPVHSARDIPSGSLCVRLRASDRENLESFWLELQPLTSRGLCIRLWPQLEADRFVLPHVLPGRYRLRGRINASREGLFGQHVEIHDDIIIAPGVQSRVSWNVEKGSRLTIRIASEGRSPLAARCKIFDRSGREVDVTFSTLDPTGRRRVCAERIEEGSFNEVEPALPAGLYIVQLLDRGQMLTQSTVTLRPDHDQLIELNL